MNIKKIMISALLTTATAATVQAQSLADWTERVEKNGKSFPQEKVFLHMDNSCYFLGDTIWFKAYVTRTDTKKSTDLSKILYVELLTPDGFLVERQQIPLENDTTGYGNFVLTDSLYGGFYELRAYTRWMLNFGRIEPEKVPQEFGYQDYFFNTDAMKDFFVDYEKLYSRVFPVYDKPQKKGVYEQNMTVRPLMRYFKTKQEKPKLTLSFYPEGGYLIAGTEGRVAYELTDDQLKKICAPITIRNSQGTIVAQTTPNASGRGAFTLSCPEKGQTYTAELKYEGYDYKFELPQAAEQGCALNLIQNDNQAQITLQPVGLPAGKELGLHILNSGILRKDTVCQIQSNQPTTISIALSELPTGVNQVTLFDAEGRIYAERLFFVRHEDTLQEQLHIEGIESEYSAFAPIQLTLSQTAPADAHVSLAVRDASTMTTNYDNGSILTEMLLGSELKGFIENPGYYFEANDSTHRADLDLLMMVQGWRRYKWTDLSGTGTFKLNYLPEKYQTLSGRLYKDYGDIRNQSYDRRNILDKYLSLKDTDPQKAQSYYAKNYCTISKPAVVHADYAQDTLVVETEQYTDNGYFYMTTPRFFGKCVLFLSANDSTNNQAPNQNKSKNGLQRWIKNKMERMNGFANEEAFPEYYIKRDLFFPLSSKPYSYYQDNLAGEVFMPYETESATNIYNLPEISVRSNKGGLRKISRSKPALVLDAYRGFNDALDLGLVTSPRYYQDSLNQTVSMLGRFPLAYTGDYGTNTMPKVRVEFNNRSKSMGWGGEGKLESYRYLKYTRQFKIYTDFAPRERGNDRYAGSNTPEIVFNAIQYGENMERQTYRDRYIILSGFAECDAFYSPDYSKKPLPETKDYRRTLYWNPDIRLKPGEKKTITFYNNGKNTKLSVDAEGLGQDGTLLSKQIGKK